MIRLKEIRIANNMSQKEVAKKLNLSRSSYSVWEINCEIIPLKHLIGFSEIFNVSIDYILGFTELCAYDKMLFKIDSFVAGNRLKEFRKENFLTQEKLAKVLNTTQTVIAGYESGRRLIATPFLYAICKKYHISADYLLGKIEYPKMLDSANIKK